jgi:amidophosphoribosyltransferase
MSILILTDHGIIAARDKLGRLPVLIGKSEDGHCVSFESFAYIKQGYHDLRDLGPGEIVLLTADSVEVLSPPRDEMKICAFLWTYYGYPNSSYEGVNVEVMRNRNGESIARHDMEDDLTRDIDYVAGVPDSGVPHAIGYANESRIPFARPFVKYTPTWRAALCPPISRSGIRWRKMKLLRYRS